MLGVKAIRTAILAILCVLFQGKIIIAHQDSVKITNENVTEAEKLIGLDFSNSEKDSMLDGLSDQLKLYRELRIINIENWTPPALLFNPIPAGMKLDTVQLPITYSKPGNLNVPKNQEELAYYSIGDLAELIRSKKITSTKLTKLFLDRLKKYDPKLHCVVTLTEDLALRQAAMADSEISSGYYRGPLHGIPYGVKDLLAVKGYKTTWGSPPYKDQIINQDASIIKKLDEAGAVLLAKLSLGELAWGDVWTMDTTRNPWNPKEGSSGSSAGPAAAVSAGLLPFAIGTETWGSIVSPSTRCGDTGLRPTYGRVSRTGAMALSWSMDKIGPICRTVEDCAIVFDAVRGPDGIDQTLVEASFNYKPDIDFATIRIGYLKKDFESDNLFKEQNNATLKKMTELGANLTEINLPNLPINSMQIILSAEAAAAFDELTRSGRDKLMVRQVKDSWPNVFRASRFIPAVEYIQANRLRTILIEQMDTLMKTVDIYISPSFEGDNLLLTNLSGHPCVVVPNGFDKTGDPTSITFIGGLYQEALLLALAKKYQDATDFHKKHPPLFK